MERLRLDDEAPKGNDFPQFSRLPKWIRDKIWDWALPSRIVTPVSDISTESRERGNLGYPPPAVARVCRESRAVAKKRGGVFTLRQRVQPVQTSGRKSNNGACYKYRTWFDGVHDVLVLNEHCLPGALDEPIGLKHMMEKAETIMVHARHLSADWLNVMFQNERVCKTLQTILLKRTHSEVAHPRYWHLYSMNVLFEESETFVLDLSIASEVSGFHNLLQANHPSQINDFERWMEYCALENEQHAGEAPTLSWAKELLNTAWSNKIGENPLHQYFAAQRRIARGEGSQQEREMPQIRPVYVVEEYRGEAAELHPVYWLELDMDSDFMYEATNEEMYKAAYGEMYEDANGEMHEDANGEMHEDANGEM